MMFISLSIIFYIMIYVTSQSVDHRVISSTGERLPIYTGLYYAITSRTSEYVWFSTLNQNLSKSLYLWNKNHWCYLTKKNDASNGYWLSMHRNYAYNIEKVTENYYKLKVEDENEKYGGQYMCDCDFHQLCFKCSNELKYHWKFTVMPDYKLNAVMIDFQYEVPNQDVIAKHIKKIELQHTSVLTNDNPGKFSEKVSHEVEKTQTFDVSLSESISKSAKYFEKFSIHGSISASIFGLSSRTDRPAKFVMDFGENKSFTKIYSKSVSSEVKFKIEQTVLVPPYEKLEANAYIIWVDNLALSYKAKVEVTGSTPRFAFRHMLYADEIKNLLSKYGFDERLVEETSNSLTFEVHGNLIGSFGLDTGFSINSLGKTENYKLIKKQSLELPGPTLNIHVKEVLSRTAKVVWSQPNSGNSQITKYTVQYWRRNTELKSLHELIVSSAETSALIKELSPGISYGVTVIGENELGRGESADSVKFVTEEEEPSAPPNDITVESRGPTTIRVQWRSPDNQHWNGLLKGFYVGYRKARETSLPFIFKSVETMLSLNSKSFETETYEYFLKDLLKCTEYAIIVKAYNSAGSGPHSPEIQTHTYDGDLPPAQQLTVNETNDNSISLRWHQKDICESQSPVTSYTIHYQREDEHKWKELPISSLKPISDMSSLSTYTYTLQNLESGVNYRVFIKALNRFGSSDPSNIVITKTQGECQSFQSSDVFLISILTTAVIVIIVMIFAFVCVRRIRYRNTTNRLMMDSPTISNPYNSTTPRYMDFDKNCDKPLMMTEQTKIHPPPYTSLPREETESNQ